jgi:hypothetical protein
MSRCEEASKSAGVPMIGLLCLANSPGGMLQRVLAQEIRRWRNYSRRLTSIPILISPLLFLSVEVQAQEQPTVILVRSSPISGLPISIGLFSSEPPDIALVAHSEGSRAGHLWIKTAYNQQLYTAGKVDGDQPDFPRTTDQILSKDHVEVWLAATPDVDLPEIAWARVSSGHRH